MRFKEQAVKTIVVLSDTHGFRKTFEELDGIFSESDIIIHLGDTSADGNFISLKYPQKTHVINGNCEVFPVGVDEEVIEVEGVKIFACHGHRYSVKTTLTRLAERAKELGCRLALYGHTHQPREDEIDGVTLINPGAGTRYGTRNYLYLVINGEKIISKSVTLG